MLIVALIFQLAFYEYQQLKKIRILQMIWMISFLEAIGLMYLQIVEPENNPIEENDLLKLGLNPPKINEQGQRESKNPGSNGDCIIECSQIE